MNNKTRVREYLHSQIPPQLQRLSPLLERISGLDDVFSILGDVFEREGYPFVDGTLQKLQITSPAIPHPPDIPTEGPLVVVGNHHFGGLDGLLALHHLLPLRPDLQVVTNADHLNIIPQLNENYLPVVAAVGKDNQLDIGGTRKIARHLSNGGAAFFFPAGQVATFTRWGHVEDSPWMPLVAKFIHKYHADVLPVYFHGRNSLTFCSLRLIYMPLSVLLLMREILNKAGQAHPMYVGQLRPYERLAHINNPQTLIDHLRGATYSLAPQSITTSH